MIEKIIVGKSNIEGKGVFATEEIKKGSIICIFKGKYVSIDELKRKYNSGETRLDDPFQVKDSGYLLLEEPYLLINHSCSPNSGVREISTLVAIHDIKKDEEITYDYSTTEWSDPVLWGTNWSEKWHIDCKCKSEKCRKVITEFPLLPDELKKEYFKKRIIPLFILNKIKLETYL
ncbi:MAG: SET domain-containing protein-lysine N-methyltransferase [archaeon]|nr:SET domain-containing protein-lysine N-methyltransferase [archaeon]